MTPQQIVGVVKHEFQKVAEAIAALLRTLMAAPKPTKRRPF
jgi:hypothetical protein